MIMKSTGPNAKKKNFKILSTWDKIPPYKHLTAVQYFSSVI